ncbi:molybdopterin molybdotransferase MoeA [Streptomyces tsukubensis]|uniref:molybdopterin molybdotransferase MoeA n=1 Tax=Streptomyces tsukubensis TaxID=83656 RepID=UPI0009901A6F|nr:molybdopterin molybdotransferase MoeA [Streptomyces tsukubensis]QFR97820.1 molybdopterin molybdenumtransferase MoeA [Streptomyces tsukubensis]
MNLGAGDAGVRPDAAAKPGRDNDATGAPGPRAHDSGAPEGPTPDDRRGDRRPGPSRTPRTSQTSDEPPAPGAQGAPGAPGTQGAQGVSATPDDPAGHQSEKTRPEKTRPEKGQPEKTRPEKTVPETTDPEKTDSEKPRPETTHRAVPWDEARDIADLAARRVVARTASVRTPPPRPLESTLGLVLAAPLTALTDLPPFDTSAMDGWAVAGPGPWAVRDGGGVLAGQTKPLPLADGEAVRIATGARIPAEATAVIRSEHGLADDNGRLHARRDVVQGQEIRLRGQECRSGDQLLSDGALVTPAVLGLAAAAGYDTLAVFPRPTAEILVLGDELLTSGLPEDGLIRDALGPMLPPWLRALGAEVTAVRRLGDDAELLHRAITESEADLIVTTGGTAAGPLDHVHPVLRRIGAELLVDGVAVRPGHPMLLAAVAPGQHLVGLPGNPLAAVSGLLTLAEPLLRRLAGRAPAEPYRAVVREGTHGHPYDTRLVPVTFRADEAEVLRYNGPAMLRGIAVAEGLAVVPRGGAPAGRALEILDLPWIGGGFT